MRFYKYCIDNANKKAYNVGKEVNNNGGNDREENSRKDSLYIALHNRIDGIDRRMRLRTAGRKRVHGK